MNNPADDPPVIDSGNATGVRRQKRLKAGKLRGTQPKLNANHLAPVV